MERTEQTAIVKNTTMRDVWAFFKERAYGDGPVMLAGPFNAGSVIYCTVKLREQDGRVNEAFVGRAKAVPDADGVRLTLRLGDFPDYDRFWQWADDLVLELRREHVVRGWTHTEATPTQSAEASSGGDAGAPFVNGVIHHIDRMHADLNKGLSDLKQGQAIIYQKIGTEDQAICEAILAEMRQQRFEQGEMQRMLDAVRRVLRHIQETGLPVADPAIEQSLADIYQAVNSNLSLGQQLELSVPIIPSLLEYKISLDAGVDLEAIWKEWVERVRRNRNE
jgi:hypothetical protein